MKICYQIALACMITSLIGLTPSTFAQGEDPAGAVTHEELAEILVNLTGLYQNLGAAPSTQERFTVLMVNGIAPKDGWKYGEEVRRGDLARVVVQALGLQDEVEDPDTDQSYIDYLVSMGVPVDTVGQAVEPVEPRNDLIGVDPDVAATTDPFKKPQDTSGQKPDDNQFGTDLSLDPGLGRFIITVDDVVEIIQEAADPDPDEDVVTPF